MNRKESKYLSAFNKLASFFSDYIWKEFYNENEVKQAY